MKPDSRFTVGDKIRLSHGFRSWPDDLEKPPKCIGRVLRITPTGATVAPYYKDGRKWKKAGPNFVISNQSELGRF